MWRARLSWRSPPRLRRWRVVWPLEAGSGATPASRAKAASERTRSWCDQVTISCAATIGPTPGSSSSSGTSARTWARISRSSSSASWVAAWMRRASERRTRIVASWSGVRELERRKRLQRRSSSPSGSRRSSSRRLVGRGHDHAAELDERDPAHVDGAAPSEQQHPQRLLPLSRARQRRRARLRAPSGLHGVASSGSSLPRSRRSPRLLRPTSCTVSPRSGQVAGEARRRSGRRPRSPRARAPGACRSAKRQRLA